MAGGDLEVKDEDREAVAEGNCADMMDDSLSL